MHCGAFFSCCDGTSLKYRGDSLSLVASRFLAPNSAVLQLYIFNKMCFKHQVPVYDPDSGDFRRLPLKKINGLSLSSACMSVCSLYV